MPDIQLQFDAAIAQIIGKLGQVESKIQGMATLNRRTHSEQKGFFDKGLAQLTQFAAGYVSIHAAVNLVRQAYQGFKQDIEASAAAMSHVERSMTDLIFLSQNLRDPKLRERMWSLAQTAGIEDVTEAARASYMLTSTTAPLTPEYRKGLEREIAQHRRMTGVPMEQLVPAYAKAGIYGRQEGITPEEVQNVIIQYLEKGAGTPEELVGVLPGFLQAGKLGGLSIRQSAALGAEATTITENPEVARTAVLAAFAMLSGTKGEKLGLKGNLLERMTQAGQMGLKPPEAMELMGRRGIRVWEMMTDPTTMGRIREFEGATGAERDIAAERIAYAETHDPAYLRGKLRAGYKLAGQKAEAEGAVAAPETVTARELLESRLKEAGRGSFARGMMMMEYNLWRWLGVGEEIAIKEATFLESASGPAIVREWRETAARLGAAAENLKGLGVEAR